MGADKPRLAVTMGDPAGIGPEIAVKTFATVDIFEYASPFVIGSAEALRRAARPEGRAAGSVHRPAMTRHQESRA